MSISKDVWGWIGGLTIAGATITGAVINSWRQGRTATQDTQFKRDELAVRTGDQLIDNYREWSTELREQARIKSEENARLSENVGQLLASGARWQGQLAEAQAAVHVLETRITTQEATIQRLTAEVDRLRSVDSDNVRLREANQSLTRKVAEQANEIDTLNIKVNALYTETQVREALSREQQRSKEQYVNYLATKGRTLTEEEERLLFQIGASLFDTIGFTHTRNRRRDRL